MRSFNQLVIVALVSAILPACGDDRSGPPVKIVATDSLLVAPCINGEGTACVPAQLDEVALPKGKDVTIPVRVLDAAGNDCDPSGLDVQVADPSIISVVSINAEGITFRALKDVDDPTDGPSYDLEPSTVITVSIGGVHVAWKGVGIVNFEGDWKVSSTGGSYDSALTGVHHLVQKGRTVTGMGCAATGSDAASCKSHVGLFGDAHRLNVQDGQVEFDLFLQSGGIAKGLWFLSGNNDIFAYDLQAVRL